MEHYLEKMWRGGTDPFPGNLGLVKVIETSTTCATSHFYRKSQHGSWKNI